MRQLRWLRAAFRGVGLRLLGGVLGAGIALAVIAAMQVPLLNRATSAMVVTPLIAKPDPLVTAPVWPKAGSAALVIPALGVAAAHHDAVRPIASLVKMMTAYVALQHLPLKDAETGPCLTVSDADVQEYQTMKATQQSSAAVAVGESLCEATLVRGMLVRSASNYAVLLARMVSGSLPAFVMLMNTTAHFLGLRSTHYVDAWGYDAGSVSTALEQAQLAALIMKNPVVASDVGLTSTVLPVAGVVNSFTPDVGTFGVIGVKSGRTLAAGGCDVMAMRETYAGRPIIVFASVLGQRGGDLVGPAGSAALALANSVSTSGVRVTVPAGTMVASVHLNHQSASLQLSMPLSLPAPLLRGRATSPRIELRLIHLPALVSFIRGQVIGDLALHVGTSWASAPLVAVRPITTESLWQRLR